jgi:hypothetical protein
MIDLLKQYDSKDILEVGNISHWYYRGTHDVVDKYDKDFYCINEDIVNYKPERKCRLIISISTLEHIGWDEVPRETNKIWKAVENMKSLLTDDGLMMVTIPIGYRPINMIRFKEEFETYYLKWENGYEIAVGYYRVQKNII